MTHNYNLIPVDVLEIIEDDIIEDMMITCYKDGTLLTISPGRTQAVIDMAKEYGLDDLRAQRLANHFNASTERVRNMTPAEKTEFDGRVIAAAKDKGIELS